MTPTRSRDRWDAGMAIGGVVAYVVLAVAGLVVLLLATAGPEHRAAITTALRAQALAVAVVSALAVAGLVVLLARTIGGPVRRARRLADETRLVGEVNPDHRLDAEGAGNLAPLARAVNDLAEQRQAAQREIAEQIASARHEVEQERNRLAALMAQLTAAVIVCNREGRILLYNAAARTLAGDETMIGLGRSVFGVVDRALVTHALDRLVGSREQVLVASTLHGQRLLRVHLTLVHDPHHDETPAGFVLVLEDLTRRHRATTRRDAVLRDLTEKTRASLGSIRAATESVLDYPDLSAEERSRFLRVVHEETAALGQRVESWVDDWTREVADDEVLGEVAGPDLLDLLALELGRRSFTVTTTPPPDELWLRVDSNAVVLALAHLGGRLRESTGTTDLSIELHRSGPHGQLDLRWRGSPPHPAAFGRWLAEPLEGAGVANAREVAERAGGEIWCGALDGATAYLRVLLPASEAPTRVDSHVTDDLASRPEFYDFDLFDIRLPAPDWQDRRLDELAFTVFDTETTGLDPSGGDRIVSIAGTRIVNGRLLRQERFERLVDPRRGVPVASTAIHGISSDMVTGQPTLEEVLPAFARFAEDTVLVGHNVSFDLRFLEPAERAAGVSLGQPVLDTLLLDAVAHPAYTDHSLEGIAERLGVSVVGRHTALGDALLTAEVFLALVVLLQGRGITTLGEAVAASRATFEARVDRSLYRR